MSYGIYNSNQSPFSSCNETKILCTSVPLYLQVNAAYEYLKKYHTAIEEGLTHYDVIVDTANRGIYYREKYQTTRPREALISVEPVFKEDFGMSLITGNKLIVLLVDAAVQLPLKFCSLFTFFTYLNEFNQSRMLSFFI